MAAISAEYGNKQAKIFASSVVAEILNLTERRTVKFIIDAILFYQNSGSPVPDFERVIKIVKLLLNDTRKSKPSGDVKKME